MRQPGLLRRGIWGGYYRDGWLDLLVSTSGNGVLCFTNRGDGTFGECSEYAGTLSQDGATTMALADIDGNGPLDSCWPIIASRTIAISRSLTRSNVVSENGQMTVAPAMRDRFVLTDGHIEEYSDPGQLYLNDGKGHFTPLSWT